MKSSSLRLGAWIAIAAAGLSGCVPNAVKPETFPGQPEDPGRFEEAAADDAERQADAPSAQDHRQRATAERFSSQCDVVTFLYSMLFENSLGCHPDERLQQPPPKRFL